MAPDQSIPVPDTTPAEVAALLDKGPRVPVFDPTVGVPVDRQDQGTPPTRIVAIGDSLTHGFQSGAVYNTDLSYPAIIANELGWFGQYRYPRYGGPGGLPLNVELMLRDLQARYGASPSWWELPLAVFEVRRFMDEIEDYWERGAGSQPPPVTGPMHDLGVYGWDLRDALVRTYANCAAGIEDPKDNALTQVVENNNLRAALRVYPGQSDMQDDTVFDVARKLGDQHDDGTDAGIETLIVFLGANNALSAVTKLNVSWSGPGYDDPVAKSQYTVWLPSHFASEFALVAEQVRRIKARHVIWCTVPHVTIAPIARGIGRKTHAGSAYFPYYAWPWIKDADFDIARDKHITGGEAYAVDMAIDEYNRAITQTVVSGRQENRDWYLLDVAGVLDRLATRRYIEDPNARPEWWTPYPLPPLVAALDPTPDSRFLTSDEAGNRLTGGLFSLDGVHPTTVAYGIIAQEMINIMVQAGVVFVGADGKPRPGPVGVDFARLIRRDTLINHPPANISSTLDILDWAEQVVGWVTRALVN